MNKISLLIVSLFFLANNANAIENNRFSKESNPKMKHYGANPISFIENGIAFYVFPDGQFDFDTPAVQRVVYSKHGRRNGNLNVYVNLGINILQDHHGRIIRIGNVPLAYDKINRIKRIGSVWMDYHHYGLANVGGLHIIYNNYNQIIQMAGNVNNHCASNNYPNYGSNYGSNENHYDSNDDYHPTYGNDDYKKDNGNREKGHGNGGNRVERNESSNKRNRNQGRR